MLIQKRFKKFKKSLHQFGSFEPQEVVKRHEFSGGRPLVTLSVRIRSCLCRNSSKRFPIVIKRAVCLFHVCGTRTLRTCEALRLLYFQPSFI
ncbi:MAG: hypothetical protein MHM6MM_000906 [Cercozoa sp. M6MM]